MIGLNYDFLLSFDWFKFIIRVFSLVFIGFVSRVCTEQWLFLGELGYSLACMAQILEQIFTAKMAATSGASSATPVKPTLKRQVSQPQKVKSGVFLEPSKIVEALDRFGHVNEKLIQELLSRSDDEEEDVLKRYAMFPLARNNVCPSSGKLLESQPPIHPVKQTPVSGPIFTGHIETDMDSTGGAIAAAELYGGWDQR